MFMNAETVIPAEEVDLKIEAVGRKVEFFGHLLSPETARAVASRLFSEASKAEKFAKGILT
jgi:hypothetical protein